MNTPLLRDTVIEINLDNISYNIKQIRSLIGEDVAIAAVLKANGYGHGAVNIAQTIMESGANLLAVANLTEALELRRNYENYDILIMGHTPNEYLEYAVKANIMTTVFSLDQAIILDDISKKLQRKARIHIKYDTGFNRLGFKNNDESIEEIIKICNLNNITCEGLFSHFALKNKDTDKEQDQKFRNTINTLKNKGINFKYYHICDSIAGVDYSQYRLNMIRPGAIIYGMKSYEKDDFILKPSMTFKTKISHIKKINKGEGVSYDYYWVADRDSIIGTLPFGYADGYPRNMKDKGSVTINGQKAPIIGVICMDQCMVDLTDIPHSKVGDEAIIFSDGTNNTMTVQELSVLAQTNKNEILSRITRRVPRIYIKDNKVTKIWDYLLEGGNYEY